MKKSILGKGKENSKSFTGCRGRRIKILPEKSDIIGQEDLVQRGKVVAVGPEARCKVGDTIIFSNDGFDTVTIGDEKFYYVLDTDQFVYEIISSKNGLSR